MWHEARKQERKIRGMLVDYRRRAERRQDFYEKIVSNVIRTNCELLSADVFLMIENENDHFVCLSSIAES